MEIISQKHKPLEHIKLVTIIKIAGCDVCYHEGENPYTQISISGLVLDGFGDVVQANIEDSAEYGDDKRVRELVSIYAPGSLHLIESQIFHFSGDEICFYGLNKILPIAVEDVEKIQNLFAGILSK